MPTGASIKIILETLGSNRIIVDSINQEGKKKVPRRIKRKVLIKLALSIGQLISMTYYFLNIP